MTKNIARFSTVVASIFVGRIALADVRLPDVISDHMVLQSDIAAPIWGLAKPGEKVTVKFRDQEKSAVADKEGKWSVKLDALKVGGPDSLSVAGANSIEVKDVLVGDVWVGSGQSNMQMGGGSYIEKDKALEKNIAQTYPTLRVISPRGKWVEATPANNKSFSALLFSFGVPLHKEINRPLGLMVGAVGGTPSGMWLMQEHLDADPAIKTAIDAALKKYDPAADEKKFEEDTAKYNKELAEFNEKVAKEKIDLKKAGAPRPPRKPVAPVKPGLMDNGQKAPGSLYVANVHPYVPFAIRGVLWDQGESGTAIRGLDQYVTMGALISGWRKDWGQGDFPFLFVQKPSGNGIALDPSNPVTAEASKFVGLPNAVPSDGGYRELHIKIRDYPNTFIVTSTDLGSGTHPINKAAYGIRASQVALGAVYSKKVEYYGPVFSSLKVETDRVRVSFTHVGQGLVAAQSQKLQGFAIAGEDKKFYWAEAVIDGDSVILHCDKVAKPVAVRYAYSGNIAWANLFNKDGLPAQAFRTDSW